jgi:hypothetical protein
MKTIKSLVRNQSGMGLSAMIALGFVAAVVIVFIIALVVYFVKS